MQANLIDRSEILAQLEVSHANSLVIPRSIDSQLASTNAVAENIGTVVHDKFYSPPIGESHHYGVTRPRVGDAGHLV